MTVPVLLFLLGALPPACDAARPSRCALPVLEGQTAPFAGQLLTIDLAISLGQKAEACSLVTAAEVERAQALAGVDLGLAKQLHAIDLEAGRMRERLLEEARPRWFERPFAVAAATAVVLSLGLWGASQIVR